MQRLKTQPKVVGTKQTLKSIQHEQAICVFIAQDAQTHVIRKVKELAEEKNIPIEYVERMEQLGEACDVEVKTATAALIKQN